MLISETTGDFERFADVEHAAEVGDRLAACFEAAQGAFSRNTERALRADVEIFEFWCRQHGLEAVPAGAAVCCAPQSGCGTATGLTCTTSGGEPDPRPSGIDPLTAMAAESGSAEATSLSRRSRSAAIEHIWMGKTVNS